MDDTGQASNAAPRPNQAAAIVLPVGWGMAGCNQETPHGA